ncbi:heat shock protein 75 kDa, mitochondrial-like [Styela clava]
MAARSLTSHMLKSLSLPSRVVRNHMKALASMGVKSDYKYLPYTTNGMPQPRNSYVRLYSTTQTNENLEHNEENKQQYEAKEHAVGEADKYEFQAETAELLNIVAKSLYSENEIFIRELISNSSDALEKYRYQQLSEQDVASSEENLEINIYLDKYENTITIQDNGIGMSAEDLVSNLGVIARSGSKKFLEELKSQGKGANSIIGQFGVGFYSAFMVGSKVVVFSKPHNSEEKGFMWTSEGGVSYEISEAEDVLPGTKIIITLKPDCRQFATDGTVKEIVQKYSNFVSFPVKLDGVQLNTVQPLWTQEPSQIDEDMHLNFFRYLSGSQTDHYLYKLFYKTDAPLNIRSVFYFPESRPSLVDMAKDTKSGVSLYSRRVLIQDKTEHLLPKWLRFVRGVVDSEDIPLNLSRELLQNSSLIAKLRQTLTGRLIRFFVDQSKKDPEKYKNFHSSYKMFITEGVLSEDTQEKREEVAQLLRYETSNTSEGETKSLDEYISGMEDDQRNIFYLCAPSRQLAETSPYYEAIKSKNMEVLFCYEPYDEIMMLQLKNYNGKQLFSVENEIVADMFKDEKGTKTDGESQAISPQMDKFTQWAKGVLGDRVTDVKSTTKLDKHPSMVTVWEMGSVRHFIRSQYLADPKGLSEKERSMLFKPVFQLNVNHPAIIKLGKIYDTESELATLALEQLYENAMVSAGLVDDARPMVGRLNNLLTKVLEKL